MARTLTLLMHANAVPTRSSLQQAINALGFKLTVESDYIPLKSKGYLPFTLDGEDAGFNISFTNAISDPQTSTHLKAVMGDNDVAIHLRWGGDARERASALIFAATMAKSFAAIVLTAEEDKVYQAEQLINLANETLENAY
jgi:hypothetical protein